MVQWFGIYLPMQGTPGLGRSNMPWSKEARGTQLVKPMCLWSPCDATGATMRSLELQIEGRSASPKIEKALVQQ